MRRRISALFIVILLSISSMTSAESNERISIDLDRGMISTAPVANGEVVIIKSIGHLTALDIDDGSQMWVVKHPTPHLFEISPPLFHSSIGNDLLLVGWTDGMVCAYDANTGEELWNRSTEMKGYGITGAMLVVGSEVIVPYDHGLMALDIMTGSVSWDVVIEEELFYRSSPVAFGNAYLMGSETGVLWEISANSTPSIFYSPAVDIESPMIRGPVTVIGNRILIPVQGSSNGGLIETDGESTIVHPVWGAIAILADSSGDVVVATSQNTTIYDCTTWCVASQKLTNEPVSGEVGFKDGIITLPINDGEGRWLRFSQDCDVENCTWVEVTPLFHSHSQYLTAGVGYFDNAIFMVNDAGWVDIVPNGPLGAHYESNEEQIDTGKGDISALLFILPGAAMIAIGMRKESWAKYLPALGASIILLGAGYYLQAISELTTPTLEITEDPLRASMPELWIDTQVVVFEFENRLPSRFSGNETFLGSNGEQIDSRQFSDGGRVFVGGLEGYADVRSLTIAAAEIADLEYVEHHEDMGYRVDRIGEVLDGEDGYWLLYWEDGNIGQQAINANSITGDAVIIWRVV
ncbi:MAG: PQQ-binding-like beta-propeller repeat protein [Candidatus Poseidoniaceae archaeon]|nr:PQQ-binding-like beta-propeller repeat protein [Candidatus Poseidoniaceae archaeon]